MSNAKFVTASDAIENWRDDVLTGKPPTFYRIADAGPLAKIEIGPKLITLVGGAPGSGKTAFIMRGPSRYRVDARGTGLPISHKGP
ncbi:MAG: hypothetical protein SGI77_09005 [Pirellulaceae bacterium]|nr:hypothetical protein [Pirellulaceae bacterium]